VSTNFTYDNTDVVRDTNSDGTSVDYLNGPGVDNKIWQKSGATQYYFSQDHLGSTTALTTPAGRWWSEKLTTPMATPPQQQNTVWFHRPRA